MTKTWRPVVVFGLRQHFVAQPVEEGRRRFVLGRGGRRDVPEHRGGVFRVVGLRGRDQRDPGVRGDSVANRIELADVGAFRELGHQQDLTVEPGAEAVDEQVIRLLRRGVLREVALVGEAEPEREHRHGQDEQHQCSRDRRRPRPVLDDPAPPVGRGLTPRLRRPLRHLTLERGEEDADDEDDHGEWQGDHERIDLEPCADERDRDETGGDQSPPTCELDPRSREAEQRGEKRERRDDRYRHYGRGTDREPLDERDTHQQHPEQGDHDREPCEEHGSSCRVDGDRDRLAHGVPGVELFAMACDDQERVVDPDAEPDHDAEERGEIRYRQDVAQQGDDRDADPDAEQRHPDREAHGEHRAERDDQDDDRERQPEDLRRWLLELREDEPAELDAEPVDVGRVLQDLVADLTGARGS